MRSDLGGADGALRRLGVGIPHEGLLVVPHESLLVVRHEGLLVVPHEGLLVVVRDEGIGDGHETIVPA